jgi:hypothetical protein
MAGPQIQCGDDCPVQDKSSAPLIVLASDCVDKEKEKVKRKIQCYMMLAEPYNDVMKKGKLTCTLAAEQ